MHKMIYLLIPTKLGDGCILVFIKYSIYCFIEVLVNLHIRQTRTWVGYGPGPGPRHVHDFHMGSSPRP